jgi:NTP pyrophosphatase (non-canonical NTP hydrolase)
MTPAEYMKAALRTEYTPKIQVQRRDGTWEEINGRLLHGMIGGCTETGEAQDAFKKNLIYGKTLDNVNVLEEIGDRLWYIALELNAIGATFEDAFVTNIAKLCKRFPDKFTEENALVRDTDAERKALER